MDEELDMDDEVYRYIGRSLKEITESIFNEKWAEYEENDDKRKRYLLKNWEVDFGYSKIIKKLKTELRNNAKKKAKHIKILLKNISDNSGGENQIK